MTKTEDLYMAFCEHATARLRSGEALDPKELESYVRFLKDAGVVETPENPDVEVPNLVLKRAQETLAKQMADH